MTSQLNIQERTAIARLQALLELLPTALDKRLRAAGITAFEYTLLETLAESGAKFMRMSALAAKTNATLPRISRVANSLERRGLAERTRCAEDARATNLTLTDKGAETYESAKPLYAEAVRELVLDGLQELPGDGATQLADLSYALLSTLDVDRRGGLLAGPCAADPAAGEASGQGDECAADPVQTQAADRPEECAADPVALSS